MTEQIHLLSSIGIDMGSQTSKIAAAKMGGVEILANEASFRETPSIVGYGSEERKIGEAGSVKLKSNFKDTVIAPQRYLGLSANSELVKL